MDLFSPVEQDPTSSYVFITAARAVAPGRVGEGCWGDQHTASLWDHLISLVEKFRFALQKVTININCPQQYGMLCFRNGIPWIQLAVPIGIASFVGCVALEIGGSRSQQLLNDHQQAGIVQGDQFLNAQPL